MGCFNAGTVWKPGQGISCAKCGAKAQTVGYRGENGLEEVWECSRTNSYIAEYGAGYGVVPGSLGGSGKKRSGRLKR
jgi:hypothetical protein